VYYIYIYFSQVLDRGNLREPDMRISLSSREAIHTQEHREKRERYYIEGGENQQQRKNEKEFLFIAPGQ
jgi:hypothetical protein